MSDFSSIFLYALGTSLFMLPIVLALILITFAANLFSGLFKPITEPVCGVMETVSGLVPNPLDRIPSFPKIKRYFGSTKNILFVCFAIIFLLFHYRSLGNVDIVLTNISLLFPGSAFDTIISFAMSGGDLDISSFFVNPENYLRTIIFSFITGLFLHMGCTTKAADAKIHFLVKLVYTMLITLFSSVVLGKIPPDIFTITLPDFSLELASIGTVTGNLDTVTLLATLQQLGGILLKKLVSLIPVIVAGYFLTQSVSSFAAAFLGGFVALAALSVACPQVFVNPDSYGAAFLFLVAISLAEIVALFFGEFVNKIAGRAIEKIDKVFEYYNIVSLLLSYFFYPTLVLPFMTFISFRTNGFDLVNWLIGIACLIVFSFVTFVGYKIKQWVWKRGVAGDGAKYAAAMVINIPIWIIYFVLFKV